MRRSRNFQRRAGITAATVALLALTACSASDGTSGASESVTVGLINSYSGPFAFFGPQWESGFRAALDAETDGTNTVGGVEINVEVKDDQSDPATGASLAKELLGEGASVLVGTSISGTVAQVAEIAKQNQTVFIGGATGSTMLPGLSEGTFVTQGNAYMLTELVLSYFDSVGAQSIAMIGTDTTYGQSVQAALNTQGEALDLSIDPVLLPITTQDFTAGVQRALASGADALYIAWSGEGTTQLIQTLAEQGVFAADSPFKAVLTDIGDPSTFRAIASAVGEEGLAYLKVDGHYAPNTSGSPGDEILVAHADPDLRIASQQASGYLAGLMLVKLIQDNRTDITPDSAHASLAGASFEGAQGEVVIREEDHYPILPGFIWNFTPDGKGDYDLTLVEKIEGDVLVPDAVAMGS